MPGDLEPLLLQRRRPQPATWAVVTQTLVTLAVIFAASQLFVHQLDVIGPMLGLPAAVTALLLSPIATVPSGLGLLFTPWRFDTVLLIAGLATMAAIGYLLILLRTGRFTGTTVSFAALFYPAFAACLIPALA